MTLKALIDLANKIPRQLTPEEREENDKAFGRRMRQYNIDCEERIRRSTPSAELLNKGVGIL